MNNVTKEKRIIYSLYLLEAVLCILAVYFKLSGTAETVSTTAILSFPFLQIGGFLSKLSLGSGIGNIAAWIILFLISLIPTGIWLILWKLHRKKPEDLFLPILSVLIFGTIYGIINPSFLADLTDAPAEFWSNTWLIMAVSITLNSLILLYLILRLIRWAAVKEDTKLTRVVRYLLSVYSFVIVFIICYQAPVEIYNSLIALKEKTEAQSALSFNLTMIDTSGNIWIYLFQIFYFIKKYFPVFLEFILLLLAAGLLEHMEEEPYSKQTETAADRLANWSRHALFLIIGLTACWNLIQLFNLKLIKNSSFSVSLPLDAIVFTLFLLLVSRSISASCKLKQDNDLFI